MPRQQKTEHSSSYYRLVKKLKSEKLESEAGPSGIGAVSNESVSLEELPIAVVPEEGPNIADRLNVIIQSDTINETITAEGMVEYPNNLEDIKQADVKTEKINKQISLNNQLRQWANENKLTHTAINGLLVILRENGHVELPKDSRTLLQTPSKIDIAHMGTGKFWYNGIGKNLSRCLQNINNCPNSISLLVNIDGMSPFNSTSKQFWPILFLINELRMIRPMVAAIYYGETKPPLSLFFEQFVTEMNELIKTGLELGEKTIKITLKGFVCDTPARSFIKGTPACNAEYGSCIKCTVVGEYDRKGRHMSYPRTHCPLRTDQDFRSQIDEDHHKEDTPLVRLPIDMIQDFVVAEPLHLIDLGITRRCLYGWRDGSYNFRTKFSKLQIEQLSKLLEDSNQTRPSYDIKRHVRGLTKLKDFKGSEYRTFLLYLGPVFLKDFLAPEVYQHFLTLSCAITILSCNFYLKYIDIAEELLESYIENFIQIYGEDSISSNMHNLSHVINDVKRFGPLPLLSAYPFENELGHLKPLGTRSGNLPLSQIAKRSEEMSFLATNCLIDHDKNQKSYVKHKIQEHHYITECVGVYTDVHITENFYLSLGEKNSYFLTNSNEVVCLTNGTYLGDQIKLFGQKIQNVDDFFKEPFASSNLHIYMTKNITKGPPQLFSLNEVKCKLFRVNSNTESVFFPLIHTLDYNIKKK